MLHNSTETDHSQHRPALGELNDIPLPATNADAYLAHLTIATDVDTPLRTMADVHADTVRTSPDPRAIIRSAGEAVAFLIPQPHEPIGRSQADTMQQCLDALADHNTDLSYAPELRSAYETIAVQGLVTCRPTFARMAIERAVTIAEQAVHSDMVLPDIFEPQLILDRGIQSYASLLDEQTLPVEAMARKRNAFCSGYLDTHQAEAIASPGVAALHVRTWRYLAGTAIIIGEDAGAQSNANEADAHFERAISVKGLVPHTDTLWLADYSSSKRFKQELEHILPDTTIAAMARHHQLVSAAKHQLALLYTETVEN